MANNTIEIEEFFKKFPDYKEVQSLISFFREVTSPPYKFRGGTLVAEMDNDLELHLKKMDNGARLSIGIYDDFASQFWEKASIYAGLTPTGVWAYGLGNEQRHDVRIELRDNYLSNQSHKQIFELVGRFYEKFKDFPLDKQRVFDGKYTEHPPMI